LQRSQEIIKLLFYSVTEVQRRHFSGTLSKNMLQIWMT